MVNFFNDKYTELNVHSILNMYLDYFNSRKVEQMKRSASNNLISFDDTDMNLLFKRKNSKTSVTKAVDTSLSLIEQNTRKNDAFLSYISIGNNKNDERRGLNRLRSNVLIYDNRSGYINGTKLLEYWRDDESKTVNNLFKTKFVETFIEKLETMLNCNELREYFNKTLPCYNEKQSYFKAIYEVEHVLMGGLFIHPCLLPLCLTYANTWFAIELSLISINTLTYEVEHECFDVISLLEKCFDSKAENNLSSVQAARNVKDSTFKQDLLNEYLTNRNSTKDKTVRKKKVSKKTVEQKQNEKQSTSAPSSPEPTAFELLTNKDLINKNNKQKHELKSLKHRRKIPTNVNIEDKAVIVLLNPYIPPKSLQEIKIITCLMSELKNITSKIKHYSEVCSYLDSLTDEEFDKLQLPKYAQQFCVYRTFIGVQSPPLEIIKSFNKAYEDEINIDIKKCPETGELILLIDNIKTFNDSFTEYINEYMRI